MKKFSIILSFIFIIFSFFMFRVIDLNYNEKETYLDKYYAITDIYTKGASAPRGRILDCNGNILVDNIGINSIFYHKKSTTTLKEELEVAKKLVELTNYEYQYDDKKLKDFFLLIHSDMANSLVTLEEKELYKERKITKEELTKLKKERITEELLDNLTEEEKYSSYFYYLMNDGYTYDNKRLLKNLNDELYASILEANLTGIFGELEWVRAYPYEETLKTIFGSVSESLPKGKEKLLDAGYSLEDKVGISGLEEYYEEYLKGEKAVYKVNGTELELVSEAKKGKDLILNIDIEIELKVEEIIKEQITNGKKLANTEFYRESYAIVSEPLTGNIKAIAGIRKLDNGEFQDVSINVIKNAYTVGSAVKAASMTVGYQNNIIDIGSTYTDGCVKLANLPAKCSYARLGVLDDKRALALSSNYYQFMIALGVSKNKYSYNMKANVTEDDFETYRNTFKSYGLGTTTGIDLPNESSGLKGEKTAIDLLLNLSIGQYDLYTPTSLMQYINTIASHGSRLKLNLMNKIMDGDKLILENKKEVLNKVDLEDKYMKRIEESLHEVMKSGTGYWYANPSINAAGKTGTSESYIDSDYNGTLDAYVLSNTFLMYAPINEPKYSIVVISPNTSNLNSKSKYRAPINRLIARNINDYLFSE